MAGFVTRVILITGRVVLAVAFYYLFAAVWDDKSAAVVGAVALWATPFEGER